MKSFERIGHWWIPENPEKKISGKLSFDPKRGGMLELFDVFFEDLKDILNCKNFEIIHGFTMKEFLTLYMCDIREFSSSRTNFNSQKFSVKYILEGKHFDRGDEIEFDHIRVYYPDLLNWMYGFLLSLSGRRKIIIRSDKDIIELNKEIFKKAQYTKTLNISSQEIEITFKIVPSESLDRKIGVIYNLDNYIMIKSKRKQHLKYYLDKILPSLENFLSLGMNYPVYPESICGFTESNDLNKNSLKKVNIYYQVSLENSLKDEFLGTLFSFTDVEDDLEFYLSNWFEKNERLKPVFDLYFSTVYNPSRYDFHNFLNLITAIEGYHKSRFGEGYLEMEEYNKIIKPELLKTINIVFGNNEALNKNGFKESIKSKINYLYEYSLRKRLKDIVKKYSVIKNIILKKNDWKSWIEDVVELRNQGVHVRKKFSTEEITKMSKITKKLKQILQVCLLKEMGMRDEKIKKLFENVN